jgi:hypothetical protein
MPNATVSAGFKILKSEYGPIFQCESCDVQADP